jgi:hypothetical protein
MKRVSLLLLLLSLSLGLHAQSTRTTATLPFPVDSVSGKICYQAVVPAPGVSQAELYRRARSWFVSRFPGYPHVVRVEDLAGGELAGTYCTIMQKLTNSYEVWRTLRVYVKEGRYRYEVTDFGGRDIGNPYDPQIYRVEPTNPRNVRRYGTEIAKQTQADLASLLATMKTPTAAAQAW